MSSRLYLIDTTSPFFVKKIGSTINWSKAPFAQLEKRGRPKKRTYREIQQRFVRYLKRVRRYGFNAISLDELCYLVEFPFYCEEAARNIRRYRRFLGRMITSADQAGLKVFLTSDIIFSNEFLRHEVSDDFDSQCALLAESLRQLFTDFPLVSGVVLRMGESDGVDVEGFFRSRLLIETPDEGNRLIRLLLPLFEEYGKSMIFRIWSPGSRPVGDVMWNHGTLMKMLEGINSENFILSMKYGESDYFRYLELSRHFERAGVKVLVELQTRREYEGFGAYPSFVGWEYLAYRRRLEELPNLAGIHVWCQTGGWSGFGNYTFMKGSSFWNELNTWVTIRIFRSNEDVATALKGFHRRFLTRGRALKKRERHDEVKLLIRFLRLSEGLVRRVLYIPGFASRRRYFHRMRMPPLLHAFWDCVTVGPLFRGLVRAVGDGRPGMEYATLQSSLKEMESIALRLKLPYDAEFHRDLFHILFLAQEALTVRNPRKAEEALENLVPRFREKYGELYRVTLQPLDRPLIQGAAWLAAKILLRRRRPYRLLDRLLFHPRLTGLFLRLLPRLRKGMPDVVDTRGMSLEELLR